MSTSRRAIEAVVRALRAREDVLEIQLAGTHEVAQLEKRLSSFYGMRHALCMSNATMAVFNVLRAAGVARGDEVVTAPYTWGGSIGGCLALGAVPVFADVDPLTLSLDPAAVPRCAGRSTKALLAVDLFGVPCDTIALRRVADELGIRYIADAAQSLGATRDGLPASACADAVVVSFGPGKTVPCGEGAAVITNDDVLFERLVCQTQHPSRQARDVGTGLIDEFALNCRIHPLTAIIANASFDESLSALRARQAAAFRLVNAANASSLTEPIDFQRHDIRPAFYRVSAAWADGPQPDRLVAELRSQGLSVGLTPSPYTLLYRQPAFRSQFGSRYRRPVRCRVAEHQARTRFCIAETRTASMPRRRASR